MIMKWMLLNILCLGLMIQSSGAKNVVFIVVDDLGWKDTGCYGSSFYETPHVDRLAASGMRFTDAYSANPLCSPTRASILTGQNPARLGFTSASGHIKGEKISQETHVSNPDERAAGPSSVNSLALDYYTLGEAMKDAGYQTAFLGKWHLGYDPSIPENHGFDYVVGGREHPGPPGTSPQRKFFPPWDADTLPEDVDKDVHIDDYLGIKAVEYIDKHKDKPFFICLWLYDVHAPFQSKDELVEKWKLRADPENPQHSPTMAAMVEVMDDNVGRVLDALEANGIADDTLVIFTSDNGGNMYDVADRTTPTNNAPLRSGKGNNYEGGVRIPLIVRSPGVTKPGSVNHSVISTVDHYPTILEFSGLPARPQDHKDGVSYVNALKGLEHDRGPTLSDFTHFVPATMNIPNTSLRSGDFKLYRFWFDAPDGKTHRYELFDLKNDISESQNLAATHPERVESMAAEMDQRRTSLSAKQVNPNTRYHGRSVGVWEADKTGTASGTGGVLKLTAAEKGFNVQTRVTPSLISEAIVQFEARSSSTKNIQFQWIGSGQKNYLEGGASKVALQPEWQQQQIRIKFKGRLSKIRFILSESGAAVELRHVNLLTPDGTLITPYEFH